MGWLKLVVVRWLGAGCFFPNCSACCSWRSWLLLVPEPLPAAYAASWELLGSSGLGGGYDVATSKKELLEQVKEMTEEEASQVRLVFAPEWPSKATSIEEIRKRTGTRPMSPEEFDRHFGHLPTDGEG